MTQAQIKMKPLGKGESKYFSVEQAQAILDIGKKNPPISWFIDDENYFLLQGKITEKPQE